MRLVVQRVLSAGVTAEGVQSQNIGKGLLVLLGVAPGDGFETAEKAAQKLAALRIFSDADGKTNLSSADVGAQLLVVSQFTLYADCAKGNRPSFTGAAPPAEAMRMYEYFAERCRQLFPVVKTGMFGADMQVTLINDGPFTLVLEF